MIMTRALFTQVSCQAAALDWQRGPGSAAVLPPSEGLPTLLLLTYDYPPNHISLCRNVFISVPGPIYSTG